MLSDVQRKAYAIFKQGQLDVEKQAKEKASRKRAWQRKEVDPVIEAERLSMKKLYQEKSGDYRY